MHILIVEDNVSIAKIWSMKLKKEGYEVEIAKNGKEALDKVAAIKPALILMDIMIPGINGIEVFQQLRQNAGYDNIQVIFLSSSSRSKEEIQELLDMGAKDYIPKFEISPGDLVEKIKQVLARA